MKNKYLTLFLSLMIIGGIGLSSFKAEAKEKEYSWYCVRNGNHQPPVTSLELLINKYKAISVDRCLNDGSEKKRIYLTFDAGYENGNVKKILDVMKEKNVTGAFFILDNIVIKNTELVKRMTDEGHLVCNHTKRHKNLSNADSDTIRDDLIGLEKIYYEKTGKSMSKFFRFPEGRFSERALKYVSELGYKTVFWSFAYADWDNNDQLPCEKAIEKIISNTHNGAVMLFHPTSSTNAEIFSRLIDIWRDMGYEFGTLNEISF